MYIKKVILYYKNIYSVYLKNIQRILKIFSVYLKNVHFTGNEVHHILQNLKKKSAKIN